MLAESSGSRTNGVKSSDATHKMLALIFGKSFHLDILLLYLNNTKHINNLQGLACDLGISFRTVKKVVKDLTDIGFLLEYYTGMSRVYKLNKDSPIYMIFRNFVENLEDLRRGEREEKVYG